jgi:hypothetical protein
MTVSTTYKRASPSRTFLHPEAAGCRIETFRQPLRATRRFSRSVAVPAGFLVTLASRRPAVGLALRIGMLRLARRLLDERRCTVGWRAEGRRTTQVELRAPPTRLPVTLIQGSLRHCRLEPFPIVIAISLLDVLPEPAEGLRELVRLTRPGGLLLVALPYQYDAEVTPRERWRARRT